jgi:hypothetical protein
VTEYRGALSAYVPANASAHTTDFEYPLKIYIIETVERQVRFRRLRQLGVALTVLVGICACQWPVAFSTANAVPSLPVSAHAAGARIPATISPERLAFATGLQYGL